MVAAVAPQPNEQQKVIRIDRNINARFRKSQRSTFPWSRSHAPDSQAFTGLKTVKKPIRDFRKFRDFSNDIVDIYQ
ncbi:hypothetical protein [Actinoplanes sp. NPDC026619]|uniref:hypothetical protein n=1 Tax=Actinoplanes sp. NPDC026619 TaxID=3155798 RepID=UPI0033E3D957